MFLSSHLAQKIALKEFSKNAPYNQNVKPYFCLNRKSTTSQYSTLQYDLHSTSSIRRGILYFKGIFQKLSLKAINHIPFSNWWQNVKKIALILLWRQNSGISFRKHTAKVYWYSIALQLKPKSSVLPNLHLNFGAIFARKFATFKPKNRETSFVLKSKEKRKKIFFENVESSKWKWLVRVIVTNCDILTMINQRGSGISCLGANSVTRIGKNREESRFEYYSSCGNRKPKSFA